MQYPAQGQGFMWTSELPGLATGSQCGLSETWLAEEPEPRRKASLRPIPEVLWQSSCICLIVAGMKLNLFFKSAGYRTPDNLVGVFQVQRLQCDKDSVVLRAQEVLSLQPYPQTSPPKETLTGHQKGHFLSFHRSIALTSPG